MTVAAKPAPFLTRLFDGDLAEGPRAVWAARPPAETEGT